MQLVLSLVPGGTERLTIDLVTRLMDRFRMVVCCLDAPGAWAGELTGRGIPVTTLGRVPGFHPSLGARIARVAAADGVDVIHCHHYSPFVYGRIATLCMPFGRKPGLLFTEHGRLSDAPPVLKRRIANAWLSRFAGPIFAVSEALKQHMVAEGFPAARVGVIHNGIDPGVLPGPGARAVARAALGVDADAYLVGTVARLDPVKDLPTLVAAIARVKPRMKTLTLAIVGDGEERGAIQASAEALGLSLGAGVGPRADVTLVGYRADVRAILPAFDLFVNCSISEGVSLTILEAMATGLPVVATGVGGTPEVVVHGETGLLVEARNVGALAAAIEEIARDPARGARLGAAGRTRVERLFTIDRMVGDYAREYVRLAGSALHVVGDRAGRAVR